MGGFEDGPGRNIPGMMSMVRYNSNSSLDTTFGTGGISLVTPVLLGPETLALLSNGDYLAVSENGNGTAGIVAELSPTGHAGSVPLVVTGRDLPAHFPAQRRLYYGMDYRYPP
jgi:hypothetical protein